MPNILRSAVLAITSPLIALAVPAHAQPSTAGTPVAETHLAAETNARVLADGTGGAFVGFKIAYRSPTLPAEIAVARLLASAGRHPEWAALPMLPPGSLLQSSPAGPSRILQAPQGRVFAFADFCNVGVTELVARQVGPAGANEDFGFQPTYSYNIFDVVPRGDGGALIFGKALLAIHVLVTILDPDSGGVEVSTALQFPVNQNGSLAGDRLRSVPTSGDGAIGFILLPTIHGTTTGIDMVAVRVNGAGHVVWGPSHRVISDALRDQMEQAAVSDGADGAVVVWRDGRTIATGPDIYAQRLLSTGAVATGWTAGGKAVCTSSGGQYAAAIASDDNGGAWIAWVDERNLALGGSDIYFTHVLANGTIAPGFVANGRSLCGEIGNQTAIQLARDGSGGCFAVWLDERDGEQDLYAQHWNAAGDLTPGWPGGGTPVCTDGTQQAAPAIDLVSPGRAITAWHDARTGTPIVYAAALDVTMGVLDVPLPRAPRLALSPGVNPARGELRLRLSATDAGEVRLTLFDVSGRVRAERVVVGSGRELDVRIDRLEPGLYLARASQGAEQTTTRVAVLR
jgi:hypothetical protein